VDILHRGLSGSGATDTGHYPVLNYPAFSGRYKDECEVEFSHLKLVRSSEIKTFSPNNKVKPFNRELNSFLA
jgi:hypothetical protein